MNYSYRVLISIEIRLTFAQTVLGHMIVPIRNDFLKKSRL